MGTRERGWGRAIELGVTRDLEVAVSRREAACVVDISEQVFQCRGFGEESLEGVRGRAYAVGHSGSCGSEGDTVENVVRHRLAGMSAFRAGRGVGFRDPVEVVIQGCVAGSELDKEAGVSTREGCHELKILLRGEGGVDAGHLRGSG